MLEDLARFEFDDGALAAELKACRHELRAAVPARALDQRDVASDVGRFVPAADEGHRRDLVAVVRANAARVAEALRSLEEHAKLDRAPAPFEEIRYRVYDCEPRLLAALPAARLAAARLCVIVDAALCDDPVAVAAAAAEGGAGIVQLRAKRADAADFFRLAGAVAAVLEPAESLFVINDHVAVAAALGADGVHLGQDDLPATAARAVLGPRLLIGQSAHTRDQALAAQAEGADYVGLGPMFATATKPHEPVSGPGLLDAVGDDMRIPSYAIGGLDAAHLRDLAPRLPHGAAVAAAVCRAADPEAATRELAGILGGEGRRPKAEG